MRLQSVNQFEISQCVLCNVNALDKKTYHVAREGPIRFPASVLILENAEGDWRGMGRHANFWATVVCYVCTPCISVGPIIDEIWPCELVEGARVLAKWARQVPDRETVRIAIERIGWASEEIELFTWIIGIDFSILHKSLLVICLHSLIQRQ